MTPQDFCDKVWEIVLSGAEADVTPLARNEPELETACHEALQWFSSDIAADEQRYHQLQRAFTVNLVNGQGTLPQDILPESLDNGWITDANDNFLSKVLFYLDLTLPQSNMSGYYCLQNETIYTREKGTGNLDTTPGPLTVFANFQIGLAGVSLIPPTLENDAVDRAVAYIRGHLTNPPPPVGAV
jgi:hypothetical protein